MRTTPTAFSESLVDNTWWSDFTIADAFGIKAIKDTYARSKYWLKTDPKMFAELVLTLNHKCWQHHALGNTEISIAYEELFYKAQNMLYKSIDKIDKKIAHEILQYLD